MRITNAQLKQITQEELRSVLKEHWQRSLRSDLGRMDRQIKKQEEAGGWEGLDKSEKLIWKALDSHWENNPVQPGSDEKWKRDRIRMEQWG